ncbi:UDP-N-acetylmuramate dehydrogenase [Myxococcota bacterium]|nr:UDP-N-acetylmuramate dehydrogenase [Myxococcota bacterium]
MISAAFREALTERFGDRVTFDVPMSRCISLRVGGPSDALVIPDDREELSQLMALCREHQVSHTVLGSGFNTLVGDGRLQHVVIQLSRMRVMEQRGPRTFYAESGVSHSQITRFCVDRGYSGLEFGAGIPGTLGGWIAMNAGIPNLEISQRIVELEIMDPRVGSSINVPREQLDFSYRTLSGLAPGSIIVSALLDFEISTKARVREEVSRMLEHRSETQPLNVPSCGSVFKNPPGDHAGRLIESVGLKGHRVGGAQISPRHANFIANTGGATAADVLSLIEMARQAVFEATGTRLETEVKILGERS